MGATARPVSVAGCATVVPHFDVKDDPSSGMPTVRSIDDKITCELDAMLDDKYYGTYLLAGEVFPTSIRGIGAGVAAAVGKIGAVSTGFLFPILLTSIGTTSLLYILVVTSLIGAVVTWMFRIETNGVNLDEIGRQPSVATSREGATPSPAVSGNGSH